jgi:hypothetical protein
MSSRANGADLHRATVPASSLGPMTRLSHGANGTIHRLDGFQLPDEPGVLVYKEYRVGVVQVALAGLVKIVSARLDLTAQRRTVLDSMTAWPLRAVVGPGNEPLGVLMKLIPGAYFEEMQLPSGRRKRVAREVQHLIFDASAARMREVDVPADTDLRSRLQICERFAFVISLLHGANLVYGDISARNVLYALRPVPTVFLVDCDAARVRGSAAVNKQQDSPDWDPPEAATTRAGGGSFGQSTQTDRYKLALFILRCLVPGRGSSLNRDWGAARNMLDARGLRLLKDALQGHPDQRPLAREWTFHLRGLLGVSPMPLVGAMVSAKPTRPAAPPAPQRGGPQQGGPQRGGWRRGADGNWVPA